MRGIKNGGTGAYLAGLDRDKMDIEEARGLERLQSDYWGQKTAFDLERQRAASSQGFSAGRGAGETFGNANQNAEALEYGQQQWGDGYSSKKKPAGGGASTGGYPTGVAGGVTGGGKSPAQVAQGRRDASSAFYKKYGHWPSPGELNDYMSGNMAQAPSYVGYS